MSQVLKDRMRETSVTTGTGEYTLAGAATGYQPFSTIGASNTTPYFATDGTNWEVGIGTYVAGPARLQRTTILASSTGGAAINWGAGTRDIVGGLPAGLAALTNAANVFTDDQSVSRSSTGTVQLKTENSNNANVAAHASNLIVSGGASGGDARTIHQVTGGGAFAMGVDNSDSDKFKLSIGSALGTSDVITIDSSGDVSLGVYTAGHNLGVREDTAGSATIAAVRNMDNTDGASDARILIQTGGGTAGDPYINYSVSGVTNISMGIDNSDSDTFKITGANVLGSSSRIAIDTTGAIQTGAATAAAGYTANGDITLPAAGAIRAQNTAKYWVAFNGSGTPTALDSFNHSSFTDNAVGDWTLNITNALTNANYAMAGSAKSANDAAASTIVFESSQTSRTTTAIRIRAATPTITYTDNTVVSVIIIGE